MSGRKWSGPPVVSNLYMPSISHWLITLWQLLGHHSWSVSSNLYGKSILPASPSLQQGLFLHDCLLQTGCCSSPTRQPFPVLSGLVAVLRNVIAFTTSFHLHPAWWLWLLYKRHAFPFLLPARWMWLQGIFLYLKVSDRPWRLFALWWR